jgi:hypothetical protein
MALLYADHVDMLLWASVCPPAAVPFVRHSSMNPMWVPDLTTPKSVLSARRAVHLSLRKIRSVFPHPNSRWLAHATDFACLSCNRWRQ